MISSLIYFIISWFLVSLILVSKKHISPCVSKRRKKTLLKPHTILKNSILCGQYFYMCHIIIRWRVLCVLYPTGHDRSSKQIKYPTLTHSQTLGSKNFKESFVKIKFKREQKRVEREEVNGIRLREHQTTLRRLGRGGAFL